MHKLTWHVTTTGTISHAVDSENGYEHGIHENVQSALTV